MISEKQLLNDNVETKDREKINTKKFPVNTVSFDEEKAKYTGQTSSVQQNATLTILDASHIIGKNDQGGVNYQVLKNYTASGNDGDLITFTNAETDLNELLAKNYEINSIYNEGEKISETDFSSAANTWKYNAQPASDQHYYIFLNHITGQINADNNYGRNDLVREVTETICYQDEDGNALTDSDSKNKAVFTAAGGVDQTTGKLIQFAENGNVMTDELGNWKEVDIASADINDPHNFIWSKEVTLSAQELPQTLKDGKYEIKAVSPAASSSDLKSVMAYQVDHNTEDFTITVTYAKKEAEVTPVLNSINYIDDFDDQVLESHVFSGNVGDQVEYKSQDIINNFEKDGLVLLSNNFNDDQQTFDEDNSKYEVHFAHGVEAKDLKKQIVTKINYTDERGNRLARPIENNVEFIYHGYVDRVTGEWVSTKEVNGQLVADKVVAANWNERNTSVNNIMAKELSGYHYKTVTGFADGKIDVDLKTGTVDISNVDADSNNSDLTLIYKKNTYRDTAKLAKEVKADKKSEFKMSASGLAFMNMMTIVIPSQK